MIPSFSNSPRIRSVPQSASVLRQSLHSEYATRFVSSATTKASTICCQRPMASASFAASRMSFNHEVKNQVRRTTLLDVRAKERIDPWQPKVHLEGHGEYPK